MHDLDRTSFEMSDEAFQPGESGFEHELPGGTFDRAFSETELDQLANELLQVHDERELDQFVGSFLAKAALGRLVRSGAGAALKNILKSAVMSAVPGLGGVLRSLAPAGVGRDVGAAVKSEVDWEGVPGHNRDIEAAKKVIAVGGSAAQQVAAMPSNAPPEAAAEALQSAAQQQGLSTNGGAAPPMPNGAAAASANASGRWYRRGRTIVIDGI